MVPYIQRLSSNVAPPEGEGDSEDNSESPPRQLLVHYKGSDNKGEFLGKYERLLSYASNILCLDADYLQGEVRFIERTLLRL